MPIKYLFIYKKEPCASKFALPKYIKKLEVTNFEDNELEVEDKEDTNLVVESVKSKIVEKPVLSGIEEI